MLKFRFFCTIISRLYNEHRVSDKSLKHRNLWCRYINKKRDHLWLMRNLKRDNLPQTSRSVNVRNTQRTFIDSSFRSRNPTRLLLSITGHRALRPTCACQHHHCTVDDWKHIAWSDQSRFQLYRSDGLI